MRRMAHGHWSPKVATEYKNWRASSDFTAGCVALAHMSPIHSASIWAAGLATAMSPDMMVMGVVKKNSRNMSTTLMPG